MKMSSSTNTRQLWLVPVGPGWIQVRSSPTPPKMVTSSLRTKPFHAIEYDYDLRRNVSRKCSAKSLTAHQFIGGRVLKTFKRRHLETVVGRALPANVLVRIHPQKYRALSRSLRELLQRIALVRQRQAEIEERNRRQWLDWHGLDQPASS